MLNSISIRKKSWRHQPSKDKPEILVRLENFCFVFKASIIVELIIPYPLAKVISSIFVCIEKRETGKLEESQDEVNTQSILV